MSSKTTPMMQQYFDIREKHEGYLLFYRMGDFYELFDEHAVTASAVLNITLTKRRSSKTKEGGIPMCGVPFHAAEGYIAKLLKAGHKVALCEQTETPEQAKKRGGYKALVKREVVRLYTGGTLTEESMLNAAENNFLTAVHYSHGSIYMAWLDFSSGQFYVSTSKEANLTADLARLLPKEILLTQETHHALMSHFTPYETACSLLDGSFFDAKQGERVLKNAFGLSTLDSLNIPPKALGVCAALLQYAQETQKGKLPTLSLPKMLENGHFMRIDKASRQNLELVETLRGHATGSLLSAINRTVTAAGNRMLSNWVNAPLRDIQEIQMRLDKIDLFSQDIYTLESLRALFKKTTDVGRALSRITLERGSPRDLVSLRTTLRILPEICTVLQRIHPTQFDQEKDIFSRFDALNGILNSAFNEEDIPLLARDGGFIKKGYCKELDEARHMTAHGMDMLRTLERQETEETGISTLRIKYNKVWGYFIEVTKGQADKIPETYIHRQTTTQTMRFSTTTLMELERKYSAAETTALACELSLFDTLSSTVKEAAQDLLTLSETLAELDVLIAGAALATEQNYCKPKVDDSFAFDIVDGCHPVVAQTVERYIPNNTCLTDGQFWLITGPNMAGKSTFLRQNALIALMAHMGYWVPAKSAHIGLIDRIFTRIGAADDLSQGQSTFMVEMVETAQIINNATERSLVILDEIGRGTATYDGLSIAWASVEHLLTQNKSRGLFATHYHEMTHLETCYDTLHCYHVAVKEWENTIVFLHKVNPGSAPRSYGIHVGKIAGLPKRLTQRAEKILARLEKEDLEQTLHSLPLFQNDPEVTFVKEPSAIETALKEMDIDALSPREAQTMLYQLKEKL